MKELNVNFFFRKNGVKCYLCRLMNTVAIMVSAYTLWNVRVKCKFEYGMEGSNVNLYMVHIWFVYGPAAIGFYIFWEIEGLKTKVLAEGKG